MGAYIHAIAVFLPEAVQNAHDLERDFPEWGAEKIALKTGITSRHIASKNEYSSDLAIAASKKLFMDYDVDPSDIDIVICISQTPDYVFPGISFQVHAELGLRKTAGTLDINLGCSGYVYGLSLARSFIESGQCKNVLLVTSDTYSKLLNPEDKSVRAIFGDGATASLISNSENSCISAASMGSDGGKMGRLIVANRGLRPVSDVNPAADPEARGFSPSESDLFMDGPGIFSFTLEIIENLIQDTLLVSGLSTEQIDLFVLHQANAFMLTHIMSKLDLTSDQCPVVMRDWGNTVSGTIPMALKALADEGRIEPGQKVLLAGFGVGLSWAGLVLSITPESKLSKKL